MFCSQAVFCWLKLRPSSCHLSRPQVMTSSIKATEWPQAIELAGAVGSNALLLGVERQPERQQRETNQHDNLRIENAYGTGLNYQNQKW